MTATRSPVERKRSEETKITSLSAFKHTDAGAGSFSGYASTWTPTPDSYGDIVVAGAFADTLDAYRRLALILFQHDMKALPIASVSDVREDNHGLFIQAEFHSTQAAQDVRTIVNERRSRGLSSGLSIGYTVDAGGWLSRKDGVRLLTKIQLFEISVVSLPANPAALVEDSKATDLVRALRVERARFDALSRSVSVSLGLKRY